MEIPTWERQKIVDEQGFPTDKFERFISTLIFNMTRNLSEEGVNIPPQSTENITTISSDTNPDSEKRIGTTWLDTDTNEFKMKDANGVVRVIPFL